MILSPGIIGLLLIAANLAWAGGYIAGKFALQHFSLYQVLLGRVVFATLCYGLLWRRWLPLRGYRKGDWRRLALRAPSEDLWCRPAPAR